MRAHFFLAVILIASAALAQDEGDLVSRSELVHDIAPDRDHPLVRKLLSAQEKEITCAPAPYNILVTHYRAEPVTQFSMNDDRVVIATKENAEFRVLKVFESETAVQDGKLYSDDDFEAEFIDIGEMHFLEIRNRISGSGGIVMDDVYTISSDERLSTIPFEEVSKSVILTEGEDLRNGSYRFADSVFSFEAGIYKSHDANCCPSEGVFHALFRLAGDFKEDPEKRVFSPDFRFVVDKVWRISEP